MKHESQRGMTVQTEGSPWRLLLLFSLPLMAGNIFQQMYTVVDTAVVGKVLGVEALICSVFGDWLRLSEDDRHVLTLCGLLHDAGKLLVPPRILNKPGKLTDEEYDIAKMHAESGFELLKNAAIDDRIKQAVLNHHERYDGSGYPAGKAGQEIDMFSTIVAIADVYDAMTSRRIYRGEICPFDVIRVFEEEGMNQFNPRYLLPVMSKLAETYIHHSVRLTDGSHGEVVAVNSYALASPVVRVGNSYLDLARQRNIRIEAVL